MTKQQRIQMLTEENATLKGVVQQLTDELARAEDSIDRLEAAAIKRLEERIVSMNELVGK
jgi:hypothetical protein